MANTDEIITVAPEYTSGMLRDQLLAQIVAEAQGEDCAQSARDKEYKLDVITYIINLVIKSPDAYSKPIEKEVKKDVDINPPLFGYTYYLSAQRNFDYTWNYMRKQMESYKSFLICAGRFIKAMVEDINTLYAKFGSTDGFSVVFNDMFNVSFTDSGIDASLIWEQFSHINSTKKCYYIKAKIDSTTLLTQKRIYEDENKRSAEMEKFVANIEWLLAKGSIKRNE